MHRQCACGKCDINEVCIAASLLLDIVCFDLSDSICQPETLWQLCDCLYFWLMWKFTQIEICSLGRGFWTLSSKCESLSQVWSSNCMSHQRDVKKHMRCSLETRSLMEQKKQTDVLLPVNCLVLDNLLIAYCVLCQCHESEIRLWKKYIKKYYKFSLSLCYNFMSV